MKQVGMEQCCEMWYSFINFMIFSYTIIDSIYKLIPVSLVFTLGNDCFHLTCVLSLMLMGL